MIGKTFKKTVKSDAEEKEQLINRLRDNFILPNKEKWFPMNDDIAWQQWVDYKERNSNDLTELLKLDVKTEFKKRAIFLLLVPLFEINPIYWTNNPCVGKFYHSSDFLQDLSEDLLSFAAELITNFYLSLKQVHKDQPNCYAEGGKSITIFVIVPSEYHDALYFYNDCLLILMSRLPAEKAEEILNIYSFNDITTYSGMEEASGYNPFRKLIHSEKIDENLKEKVDKIMRRIIEDELAGKTFPREDWENALSCYANIVSLPLYSEKPYYGLDLWASQYEFLIQEDFYRYRLIDYWMLWRICKIFSGEKFAELRFNLIRFLVFGNEKEFSLYETKNVEAAKMLIAEIGQREQKLTDELKAAIESGEKRIAEENDNKEVEKQKEIGVMNSLK